MLHIVAEQVYILLMQYVSLEMVRIPQARCVGNRHLNIAHSNSNAVYIYVYIYIYIYIYTYIHTYIHTYIYIYILAYMVRPEDTGAAVVG